LKSLFKKGARPMLGILVGIMVGYAYYHLIGCSSGTCAITSKPLNSSLYGALMGGFFTTSIKKNK